MPASTVAVFAVVADEVRALAETSDKNAREVQELASSISGNVQQIVAALKKAAETAANETTVATKVVNDLQDRRSDVAKLAEGTREILMAAAEAERAAAEAATAAEQIATAAEEQSAGASEAQSAVRQQAKSLDQAQMAAQALAVLAEDLRRGKGRANSSDQIGASAEELSATHARNCRAQRMRSWPPLSRSTRANRLQASATQETSAALTQIEKSARLAEEKVRGLRRARASARCGPEERPRLGRAPRRRCDRRPRRDAVERVCRQQARRRRPQNRESRRRYRFDCGANQHACGQRVRGGCACGAIRGADFAIVSNDIRSLAREASANIERAKDTVRGILDQIALLRTDLEQIAASSDAEVQNNRSVAALIAKITTDVDDMRAGNKAIIHGATEILAATVEAAAGARQVATASEEASAAAREAATAAAEQSRGAEDLAAAIEEVASLADELKLADA